MRLATNLTKFNMSSEAGRLPKAIETHTSKPQTSTRTSI